MWFRNVIFQGDSEIILMFRNVIEDKCALTEHQQDFAFIGCFFYRNYSTEKVLQSAPPPRLRFV